MSCFRRSVADPGSHHFGKLVDPDPDPRQSEKQDPNPHQSEKVEALGGYLGTLEGPNLGRNE